MRLGNSNVRGIVDSLVYSSLTDYFENTKNPPGDRGEGDGGCQGAGSRQECT